MGSNFLLIRYGDLTDTSPDMFKNYKIPKDHTIIPLIRNRCIVKNGSLTNFIGWKDDDTDKLVCDFFINAQKISSYETSSDLLKACRDPEIDEIIEVYYYV